ncbi:hypothetical protein RZN05_16725 [Sphingomonas sp. HF-S4]|uniref:Transmembrane protein n=1 Tax=Sphingomonas agrestis TaxID=3080540 RepID=A0ABU3YB86_9SPHN|nr:hypothetical protein [Sphingomonas sp. HF-S4]MDV3458645.1 hypothetical protein [Sphingomonas sp. HF-S4]
MKSTSILTLVWWIWGVLLILLLVLMSNLPLFGADVRAAWEWFTPNLFPIMALVGGIQYQTKKKEGAEGGGAAPRKPSWPVALVLSVLYLLLLTIALLSALTSAHPLDTLRTSNLWLGPLLALNTAALGVLFAQD